MFPDKETHINSSIYWRLITACLYFFKKEALKTGDETTILINKII